MKNDNQLRKSYEKQLKIFEDSKQTKISNLQKQIEAVEAKISKLQMTLTELQKQKEEISQDPFQDFDSFRRSAAERSEQATKETKT